MRKFVLVGASALVLALGVASVSAQPSSQQFLTRGETGSVAEGRAAAIDAPVIPAVIQPHAGR